MKQGKLAVFGCNALALDVARRLKAAEREFVMIDNDDGRVHAAREEGFHAEHLDYTDDDALRKLGLGLDIEDVFCLLREDSENVFLAITARAIDPDARIVAICREPEASCKLIAAGADKVVDPYAISGARAFDLIARPDVVELLEETVFGKQDLNIAEITIPRGSWGDGVRLSEVRGRMTQIVLLLGVVDIGQGSDLIFSTRNIDHKLDVGDILVIIGARAQINAFRAMVRAQAAPG
jgi:voltage-gated potassium channel